MKKVFFKSLDFLLFSNIFIALGAVAQGLITYKLLNINTSLLVCSFLFFATITTYNFSILINKPQDYISSKHKRVRWFFNYHRLNISLTLISSLTLIPLFFMLSFASQILVLFLGLISIGYSLPLYKLDNKVFCIRNISGLKLFLISFVWSFSVVWLPILESGSVIPQREIITLIAKECIFIAVITLPFDIRDMFEDKASNLKTLPTIFGSQKSYWISFLLLFLYLILLMSLQINGFNPNFWASIVSVVLAAWLIWRSMTNASDYHYFLFLDGVLIIQFLLFLLFDLV